jgi:ferredoxin-NADP reductase
MRYEATVTDIQQLAPQIVQVTVAVTGNAFTFRSGQWVNVRFPTGVARAYTIASAPHSADAVLLCVRVGSGKGGQALQELQEGDKVSIEGPHGDFVLPDDSTADLVLLAGDTGIAPMRSIVLDLLESRDPRAITVLYEPDQRYILYSADFDPLAREGKIVHESGAIETLIERNRRRFDGAIVMIAGFDPFLDRARVALSSMDVAPAQVIAETFGPVP